MEVNLVSQCYWLDQPLEALLPNLRVGVLQRYRQAMSSDMQRIGAIARAAYSAPALSAELSVSPQVQNSHIAGRGECLYLADIEADRATFTGPCTLRPFQIIAHAVAVIDQLRWYRNLGRSRSACTYNIKALSEALMESLVMIGAHLWTLGELICDELAPRARLAGASVDWVEQVIRTVKERQRFSCRQPDGGWDDGIDALQLFHEGLPPEVEEVFREIERLMNELLTLFPLNSNATITTHIKTLARGAGTSCGVVATAAD